jgi:hypothetical protein
MAKSARVKGAGRFLSNFYSLSYRVNSAPMPPGCLTKLPRMDEAESTHKTRPDPVACASPASARGTKPHPLRRCLQFNPRLCLRPTGERETKLVRRRPRRHPATAAGPGRLRLRLGRFGRGWFPLRHTASGLPVTPGNEEPKFNYPLFASGRVKYYKNRPKKFGSELLMINSGHRWLGRSESE